MNLGLASWLAGYFWAVCDIVVVVVVVVVVVAVVAVVVVVMRFLDFPIPTDSTYIYIYIYTYIHMYIYIYIYICIPPFGIPPLFFSRAPGPRRKIPRFLPSLAESERTFLGCGQMAYYTTLHYTVHEITLYDLIVYDIISYYIIMYPHLFLSEFRWLTSSCSSVPFSRSSGQAPST